MVEAVSVYCATEYVVVIHSAFWHSDILTLKSPCSLVSTTSEVGSGQESRKEITPRHPSWLGPKGEIDWMPPWAADQAQLKTIKKSDADRTPDTSLHHYFFFSSSFFPRCMHG